MLCLHMSSASLLGGIGVPAGCRRLLAILRRMLVPERGTFWGITQAGW